MIRRRSPESRGQILVVTAVAIFVLLAIAALVLDLGFSWMLHRKEQNAADPGSIAAARWLVNSLGEQVDPLTVQDEMNGEACFYAQQNGFFTDDSGCAAALLSGDLQVHSPPISGDYAGQPGRVQVIIHDTHPTFFARIWGQTEAGVTTAAVAKNDTGTGNSATLVALKTDCSGGAAGTVTGGGTVSIFPVDEESDPGGYVHVNSPCGQSNDDTCNGSGEKALDINGGSTLIAPFAYTVGSCVENGGGDFQCLDGGSDCLDEQHLPPLADPLAGVPEPQIGNFPTPSCPDPSEPNNASGTGCTLNQSTCPLDPATNTHICELAAGVYYGGWFVKSNVTIHLDPGLYFLAGGGIQAQKDAVIQSVESDTGTIPARVTIFSTEGPGCPGIAAQCQAAIRFTADASFLAKATNQTSCEAILASGGPNTCPWKGILLWQDGTVAHPQANTDVTLGGQSSTVLSGTIYAPKSNVSINAGQDTTGCPEVGSTATDACLSIQIISWTWKIDGQALVEMPYDPSELYQFAGRGLVE